MMKPEEISHQSFYSHVDQLRNVKSGDIKTNENQINIIDYGSYLTRAGTVYNEEPILICKSQTIRTRRNNQNVSFSGNQITPDFQKIQKKKIFENYDLFDIKYFEDFNDYLFTELKVKPGDSLIYTEPIGVTEKIRKTYFELFFECYEFDKVMPCVDSISSSFKLLNDFKTNNALVIQLGYNNTLTLPFIQTNLDKSRVRKIDIGVQQMKQTMMKLFDLKYNNFHQQLQKHYQGGFFNKEAFFALNFKNQLKYYKDIEYDELGESPYYNSLDQDEKNELFPSKIVKFYQGESKQESVRSQHIEKMQIRRKEQAEHFLRKREQQKLEKKQRQKQELDRLQELLQDIQQKGFEEFQEEAQQLDCFTVKDLKRKARKLQIKLGIISQEQIQLEKMEILNKPEDECTPEEIRLRRFYQMLKENQQKRALKKKEEDEQKRKIEQMMNENPELYLDELMNKRLKIKKKIKKIKIFKEDKKLRRQKESQQIEQFDRFLKGEQEEQHKHNLQLQNFYEEILELTSDEEKYEKKLKDIEDNIMEIDPTFDKQFDNQELYLERKYQSNSHLYIGADIIRSTEILFSPQLIGINQKGLVESIKSTLSSLDTISTRNLLSNVFVIGGGNGIIGLKNRLEKDLLQELSFKGVDQVNINIVENSTNLSYQGMRMFYNYTEPKAHQMWFYSKKEYEEYGPYFFKANPIGNS